VEAKPFEIYQPSRGGYLTVSNETHRAILAALGEGPRSFQDLVRAAKKSKPTVSQAIKQLVEQGLLEEHAGVEDRRRRSYAFVGQRIGSSDLPVPALRDAVRDYVRRTSEPSIPLRALLEALASVKAADEVYWMQAHAVGAAMASQMELQGEGGPWARVSHFLERTGIARPLRIDVEANRLDCELSPSLQGPAKRLALAVGGLVEGAWKATGRPSLASKVEDRRLSLWEK
jgi:DNA-binding transcriptional ArsR family regulator